MENNTAIFSAIEKTITFKFLDEEFKVDLTEGDLHDSWNGITTKAGVVYDFNFSWEEDTEPSMELYSTYKEGEFLRTNHGDDHTFTIVEQIGNFKDYFGYEKGHYTSKEETNSFRVDFRGFIVVDDVSSLAEAQEKVKLMEVDFNDTTVTLIN